VIERSRGREGLAVSNLEHSGLPQELWPELGRIRIAVAVGVFILALFLAPGAEPVLVGFLGFCTAGFLGANIMSQRCPVERRVLLEKASMLMGLGLNTGLILASGGPNSPLLFLYVFPVFTYGFRLGGRGAYLSAFINSLTLLILLAWGWPALTVTNALAAGTVAGMMWIEAYAIEYIVRYITSQKEELTRLAWFDPLTGLLNRRALFQEVDRLLVGGIPFGLILLDLDGFKAANDQKGHLFGDRVLTAVAQGINGVIGDRGILARYGGDEFAVILEDSSAWIEEKVIEEIERVVKAIGTEYGVFLGISSGVANSPDDGITRNDLLYAADKRLYEIKYTHSCAGGRR